MVEIVPHFARNAAVVGVVDVTGIDAEICGFAVIAYQAVASIATHTYPVATDCFTVFSVIQTVS